MLDFVVACAIAYLFIGAVVWIIGMAAHPLGFIALPLWLPLALMADWAPETYDRVWRWWVGRFPGGDDWYQGGPR